MPCRNSAKAPPSWAWGTNTGEGKVTQSFVRDVTRPLKGTKVKRTASPQEPAYLIRQADGDHVLKSHAELKQADRALPRP
ncbi:MAG: hypothetical protein E5V49_03765 [Mesorhizobium sp.]|nr:hypothetical protein EN848_12360 [bacterium M00.F.Ca.ET.205.01.1.1]TGU55969.1 hypothetical protein EN795_00665 [bacterium M00.F.Ca.ET.152.01.1.1]TGV40610.1 hypothetical protein EN829_003775 [Mesorhizobium sp. M00.F.Ca.ET.186.01.1.1]TGZ45588.1 hypothetical protein EN805_03755 [bacterium M00.F.Ca.ET.162.01.1.1]TJW34494.1 MAG: hypothetical protein E5V49_03765 [Mesorhizobium sp.]